MRAASSDRHAMPWRRVGDAANTFKVRDSCQSCAMSKIRCPKEKPICSKCERRGIECVYSIAKRPGRRRDTANNNGPNSKSTPCSSDADPQSRQDSQGRDSEAVSVGDSLSLSDTADQLDDQLLSPRSFTLPDANHLLQGNNTPPSSNSPSSLASNASYIDNATGSSETIHVNIASPKAVFFPTDSCLPRAKTSTSRTSTSDILLGNITLSSTTPTGLESKSVSHTPENEEASPSTDVEQSFLDSLRDFAANDINSMDYVMSSYEHRIVQNSKSTMQTQHEIESLLMYDDGFSLAKPSAGTPAIVDFGDSSSFDFSSSSSLSTSNAQSTEALNLTFSLSADTGMTFCDCVPQSLDLLKTISPASSLSFIDCAIPSDKTGLGLAQAVISENKHNIEAVSAKLSCSSCAEDSFLLIILSMIVLKIIERYAKAACLKIRECQVADIDSVPILASNFIAHSNSKMLNPSLDTPSLQFGMNTHGRAIAQLVLGELHRVQKLVNQLSPKLKRTRGGELGSATFGLNRSAGVHSKELIDSEGVSASPFSKITMLQIESDVSARLGNLSADIINRLRKF